MPSPASRLPQMSMFRSPRRGVRMPKRGLGRPKAVMPSESASATEPRLQPMSAETKGRKTPNELPKMPPTQNTTSISPIRANQP